VIVPWFTRVVAVLLLALWGLAKEHCALEQVPGFEFLACCQHADKAPHQDNDCDEDGCAVVESGFYQMEDNPTFSPALTALGAFAVREWVAEAPEVLVAHSAPVTAAPPELPRLWQFHYRAALPPRAPSVVA
jgi:hypothetical protein